jgi:hypothetical protein
LYFLEVLTKGKVKNELRGAFDVCRCVRVSGLRLCRPLYLRCCCNDIKPRSRLFWGFGAGEAGACFYLPVILSEKLVSRRGEAQVAFLSCCSWVDVSVGAGFQLALM